MKTMKLLLVCATVTLTLVSCNSKTDSQKSESPSAQKSEKVLVLYYSLTGTTQSVAQEITRKLGADMEEITMVNPYDTSFQATIERCMMEREQGVIPEIHHLKADVADYDVIFIGYPIWFGTYAPPVAAFLDSVDLSGKKVVPFCTFGSGGLESSVADLKKAEPSATILDGYGVRSARMDAMPGEVDQFLKAYGFIEGDYVQLEDFTESHEVSEEEAAIFDAAVEGYLMLNATAKTVCSRSIPNGTEYQFTAVDVREDDNKMYPMEIVVYVTVANGAAPVFTKVVR